MYNVALLDDAKTLHEQVAITPLRPNLRIALSYKCADKAERAFVEFVLRWTATFPAERCGLYGDPKQPEIQRPNAAAEKLLKVYNWNTRGNKVESHQLGRALHKADNVATIAQAYDRNPQRAAQIIAELSGK